MLKNIKSEILTSKQHDNSIQWKKGERLNTLFEQLCDKYENESKHNKLAVITEDKNFSFLDLEKRANQIAHYLNKKGVSLGDRIAILMDKSLNTYAALLAILKTGGAYIPLDISFPEDRIEYIISDADAKAVITLSDFSEKFDNLTIPKFYLDKDEDIITQYPSNRIILDETLAENEQLAYIIYTSGTTGKPKGVVIEHPSICNFVSVAAEVYGYKDTDRVYQGMTIAFDFSVEELWVPLLAGAALVPGKTGLNLVGQELSDFLRKNKVTGFCCVPTLLATINDDLPDLRILLVSGEACPQDLVSRWSKNGRIMLNAYGPTEANCYRNNYCITP